MSDNLFTTIPKWLFGSSFFAFIILLSYLAYTGVEFNYKDRIYFSNPESYNPVFGEIKKLDRNKIYTATSDGLVFATFTGNKNTAGIAGLEIRADYNDTPNNVIGADTITSHPASNWARSQNANVVAPILKGQSYEIRFIGNLDGFNANIFYIPFKGGPSE